MKTFTILKGLFFGSVALALSGCSSGKAADAGLKDAQQRVLAADQITVVTPTKDSWFAKNITDLPSGKEIAIKVKPDGDQEFILVKSKSGDAVILPIMDGKCSVVTDKDTVAKYQAKVGGGSGATKSTSRASGEAPSEGAQKSSWKVKGKTITAGMSKAEVIKLLGTPSLDSDGTLVYEVKMASEAVARAKTSIIGAALPFGGNFVDHSTESANPVKKKTWHIECGSGYVTTVREYTTQ